MTAAGFETETPSNQAASPSSLYVQSGSEAHPVPCTMGTGGPLPGAKVRPGRDADHSHPSSAEGENQLVLFRYLRTLIQTLDRSFASVRRWMLKVFSGTINTTSLLDKWTRSATPPSQGTLCHFMAPCRSVGKGLQTWHLAPPPPQQ
jgi:hypothetical protein